MKFTIFQKVNIWYKILFTVLIFYWNIILWLRGEDKTKIKQRVNIFDFESLLWVFDCFYSWNFLLSSIDYQL